MAGVAPRRFLVGIIFVKVGFQSVENDDVASTASSAQFRILDLQRVLLRNTRVFFNDNDDAIAGDATLCLLRTS